MTSSNSSPVVCCYPMRISNLEWNNAFMQEYCASEWMVRRIEAIERWMAGRMNGWVNGRVGKWTDEWLRGWMSKNEWWIKLAKWIWRMIWIKWINPRLEWISELAFQWIEWINASKMSTAETKNIFHVRTAFDKWLGKEPKRGQWITERCLGFKWNLLKMVCCLQKRLKYDIIYC